jgi:ATP-dependent DNA ligase
VKARFVKPMQRWQYELKVDGYRAIAFKTDGKLHLQARNDNDFVKLYPGA